MMPTTFVICLVVISSLGHAQEIQPEFRGAWIATVDNIDWPSAPGLTPDSQRTELTAMLDRASELNLNALIFQVRPAADALYESEYEPWSEYLTGEMGLPPDPYYDPLLFAIEEAHRRGLELHAWVNPYRAHHPSAKSPISEDHISRTHPEIVRKYGAYLWLDPGDSASADHSLRVILDIVRRYDVDGIHLDDYFYPYPIQKDGSDVPFPDDESWQIAIESGETRSRNDWRRASVDSFIERLYAAVKAEKSWVKVGISPFGIWRPGHPEPVRGFDAYDRLYADARKWLSNGWLDYIAPQLYWSIDSKGQSYNDLLDWWIAENTMGRHVWVGNYTSRVIANGRTRWDPQEIVDQIQATRERKGATGNIHFSMKALMSTNGSAGDLIRDGVYSGRAVIPPSPWLAKRPD